MTHVCPQHEGLGQEQEQTPASQRLLVEHLKREKPTCTACAYTLIARDTWLLDTYVVHGSRVSAIGYGILGGAVGCAIHLLSPVVSREHQRFGYMSGARAGSAPGHNY